MAHLHPRCPGVFRAARILIPFLFLALGCRGPDRALDTSAQRSESADKLTARAAALLREGRPREAVDLLKTADREGSPELEYLLGEAAMRSGRYALAEKAYREVMRLRPDDLVASTRLARIAFLEARYKEAQRLADWILARSPDHVEARALRCRIRLRLGNLNGAAVDARRWAGLVPEDPEPLWVLGVVQSQRGDPGGAIQALKRALRVDPSHLPSRLDLARAHVAAGRKDLAEETMREYRQLDRKRHEAARRRADATYHRARALEKLQAGDTAGALRSFRDALVRDPENGDLLREAGEAALSAGELEEALSYLDQAVARSPQSAPARRVRGEAALARGDPQAALADLLEAARLDPGDPLVHRDLERAYRALNRPEADREAALATELETKGGLPSRPEKTP